MTMVPVPTTLFNQQHYDGGGGGGDVGIGGAACGDCYDKGGSFGLLMSQIEAGGYEYGNPCREVQACIGSDLTGHNHMAEDESRTSSLNEAGSSSKGGGGGGGGDDEGWLQLGIGGARRIDPKLQEPLEPTTTRRPGLVVELDLLAPRSDRGGGAGGGGSNNSTSSAGAQHMVNKAMDPIFCRHEFRTPRLPMATVATTTTTTTPPPLFLQHQFPNLIPRAISLPSLSFPHHPEIAWGFNRPNPNHPPWTPSPSSPSSSATPSSSILPGPYYARPFQHPAGGLDVAGPSSGSNVRVIDAPSRPQSGVWFVLQASQNQTKEPFLPQIPRSFLRIKDGRMTVRLLMKYLVNKLRLDSESEVEITCRGQQLLPLMTLQHVRDNIWSSSRDTVTLLPDSSTTDHVMILHYGRST
ncbi:hypothetical protein NE237_006573 [Protea cynaroides]|uniref:Uncharacterized protein n=1 Tax=Protea cynaroides TaxID=273540 RepID=A0A9Q0KMV5_9MAGN|nr:hypothetical protein NE237_006573 [Protea cynaroides]